MTWTKRIFDVSIALVLSLLLLPVIAVIVVLLFMLDGKPVFYISERMCGPNQAFSLVKFRTMKPASENSGVSGGDKVDRITHCGRFLRRTRLDEVPQLWNVLRGDMSFVGPRPPLRQYVEAFPELYERVLRSRPGVSGLASVLFHVREEELLAACESVEETDRVYKARCIPRKAALDLAYQRNASLCLDVAIMINTVWKIGGIRKINRKRGQQDPTER